jgi:hypothetical protein
MNTNELLNADGSQLAEIYRACHAIDVANLVIPSKEMGFLCLAMHRMARLINEIGHDDSELHSSITNYLIELTHHSDVRVALTATYALGDHGPKPAAVVEHLCRLANSERRNDDHSIVTMRVIAVRMLKRLNPELATTFANSDAFIEYSNIINHWLTTDSTKNADVIEELKAEANWIYSQDGRRTNQCT